MKLAMPELIREIDRFAVESCKIPLAELIRRSGDAVAESVRAVLAPGAAVLILAGCGNNGADGYAAACALANEYRVTVFDVFSAGQQSEEGRSFLSRFSSLGGTILAYDASGAQHEQIAHADCIVDAIFGTGFHGELEPAVRTLAAEVRKARRAYKIAVDVPIGVNAADGSVLDSVLTVAETVSLSFYKPGLLSYPARAYVGKVKNYDLGLPVGKIEKHFDFPDELTDVAWAKQTLPVRDDNSNKGTFGSVLLLTGSAKYRGAADLSLAAALRGGVGLVHYAGPATLCRELAAKYPEAIYHEIPPADAMTERDREAVAALSASVSSTVIGSGSESTPGLFALLSRLIGTKARPLVLDADAINALADDRTHGYALLDGAARPLILTPHPMEFSRISGIPVAEVQLHRIGVARAFAKEHRVILLLKGAATLITDGTHLLINGSGSSALAKAGSGDVLAGLTGALAAQKLSPLSAAGLAAWLHGRAGDRLALTYSDYGVTPSDLPAAIAASFAELTGNSASG